jgi:hypothetical protein
VYERGGKSARFFVWSSDDIKKSILVTNSLLE